VVIVEAVNRQTREGRQMSKESGDQNAKILEGLVAHIVALQARCDAMEALFFLMAKQLGAKREAVDAFLETIRATAHQKRLETIEDRSPSMAAKLDRRIDISKLDPDLLKNLHFHS
jgi:hypothetical protein